MENPAQLNSNRITTDRFSSPTSEAMYHSSWQNEPEIAEHFYYGGKQCGGCSFFAPFNSDWGLCCHPNSRHHLETVFEHFACPHHVDDGWGAHNFLTDESRDHLANLETEHVAICELVSTFVTANDLGIVTNRDTTYLLHEHLWTVRPDLGFIAKGRLFKTDASCYLVVPDLAIKIVTSFDAGEILNAEVMMYLQSGTRQIWIVYPSFLFGQMIYVYTLSTELDFQVRVLAKDDVLDGGDVLPGFRVPVRDIFHYRRTQNP